MMKGRVNALRQAVLLLSLHGTNGQVETVEAVIDTGFDGYLAVSPDLAARLNAPYLETLPFEVGDGAVINFDIYSISLQWNSMMRSEAALVTEGGVLIGMALLSGYTLFIDAVNGGEVRIELR